MATIGESPQARPLFRKLALGMAVACFLLATVFAFGKLNGETGAWYPPDGSSALPVLIGPNDGECYRLVAQPLGNDATYYHVETFGRAHEPVIRNQVIDKLSDQLPEELLPELAAALDPIQWHIDDQARKLGEAYMRTQQLEAQLRRRPTAGPDHCAASPGPGTISPVGRLIGWAVRYQIVRIALNQQRCSTA